MLRVGDQCRPRLLIGAQSLSGMVRMVEAVLVALQASSESSDCALGNGTELHHRRVITLRGEEFFTSHETACACRLCVSLPRYASVATGYNLLQMGLPAVLKPAVKAAGIVLACLLAGAAT